MSKTKTIMFPTDVSGSMSGIDFEEIEDSYKLMSEISEPHLKKYFVHNKFEFKKENYGFKEEVSPSFNYLTPEIKQAVQDAVDWWKEWKEGNDVRNAILVAMSDNAAEIAAAEFTVEWSELFWPFSLS